VGASRTLIVDDHPILRKTIRIFCNGQDGLEVIGEAGDGAEAIRMARELKPDMVILDAVLSGIGAVQVVRAIRQETPRSRILVFTGYADDRLARTLLRVGVDGYLLKGSHLGVLAEALRRVSRGERYVDPLVAGRLLEGRMPLDQCSLTPRELGVLRLVAKGCRDQEIAARLGISLHTVHCHVKNLLAKLGASNRTEIAFRAHEEGLIYA
jgi:NarL family two-component system response regulator LiaR